MIDGLKLTMQGDALREMVEERIAAHERAVARYRENLAMDPKDQTDDNPCLPDHLLENMIDEREASISALTLIRDHIVPGEAYRLDKRDLQFADLLPPDPQPEPPICLGRR